LRRFSITAGIGEAGRKKGKKIELAIFYPEINEKKEKKKKKGEDPRRAGLMS